MNEAWSGLIDAHCHLCDERILPILDNEVSDAISAGITGFVSSALSADEYGWIELSELHTFNKYFRWSAGIHPYYEKSSEKDLDKLIQLCDRKSIIAIGEIGLDGRDYHEEWQKDILIKQLDIARAYDLPVIFHVVYKYYDLYKIIEKNFPRIRGYLHSFRDSLEMAEHFSQFDLAFSIGGRPPKQKVIEYLLKRGFILFETDSPYQKFKADDSKINHLKNLDDVVNNIADSSNLSKEELIIMQKKSFHRLFPDI
jgi:TatD DNase family protein